MYNLTDTQKALISELVTLVRAAKLKEHFTALRHGNGGMVVQNPREKQGFRIEEVDVQDFQALANAQLVIVDIIERRFGLLECTICGDAYTAVGSGFKQSHAEDRGTSIPLPEGSSQFERRPPGARENPSAEMNDPRCHVFVSYSHRDRDWLDRLRVHLRPLVRDGLVDVFDDTIIKPGSRWKESIKQGLEKSKVAILLISADFLASDFIQENELPPLLAKAQNGGGVILSIIVSPCNFAREKSLAEYQTVNPPSRPLAKMTSAEAEEVLAGVSAIVEGVLEKAREPTPQRSDVPIENYPYGIPVPDRPYLVESPYSPGKYVNVEGFKPGTKIKDPYSGKVFLVP